MRLQLRSVLFLALMGPAHLSQSVAAQEPAGAEEARAARVRAVLFYSPTCPHCETVITQTLPPLFDRYGGQAKVWSISASGRVAPVLHHAGNGALEILLIDITWPPGARIYRASIDEPGLMRTREGVPRLVVGGTVLVGSLEIPEQFPGAIQRGLDGGGVDWPRIAELGEALAVVTREVESAAARAEAGKVGDVGEPEAGEIAPEAVSELDPAEPAPDNPPDPAGPDPTVPGVAVPDPAAPDVVASDVAPPEPVTSTGPEPEVTAGVPTSGDAETDSARAAPATLESVELGRFSLADKLGRDPLGNGMAVVVLAVMLFSVPGVARWARSGSARREPGVAIPILALIGAGVAAYLTYIEATGATAVCGPVGDCNAVQQSEYATLFGWLPVGALGLAAYAAVIGAWILSRRAVHGVRSWAMVGLFVLAAAGTLFSIYLTILEPFVIGATCAWCLASAVIITAIMWLSARPAWSELPGHVHRTRGSPAPRRT